MGQALHTLIIEDSPDDAELILSALRRGGFVVTAKRVDTLAELRDALQQGTWDLVVSDYQLPGFTGLDVIPLVREHDEDLPFILVSGAIGEDLAVAAMKAGAHDYVMKDRLRRFVPAVERELRESAGRRKRREMQSELAAIVESSDDAIIGRNLSGQITAWNLGAERLFGYSAAEMMGHPITRLMPPELSDEEAELLHRLVNGEHLTHRETVRVAKDGRRIDVSLTMSPIRDPKGRIIGISKIARDIAERKLAEAARARWQQELETQVVARTAELRLAQEKLLAALDEQRRLEAQITRVTEREQSRLGQELHDSLAQQLTGIQYLLEALGHQLPAKATAAWQHLKRVQEVLYESIEETRDLAKGFYPVDLHRLGLVASLGGMLRQVGKPGSTLKIELEAAEAAKQLKLEENVEIQLFRIAQEAVHNVVKHAKAHCARVKLELVAGELVLTVCDDGVGVPVDSNKSTGMGLRIMRHRAETIGGQFTVDRAAKGGTRLTCRVPRQEERGA